MSEVEIPHAHEVDGFGKKVGLIVAVLGVLLSIVTIASHRQHTAAVVYRTEANDQWAYYQAKKIREYQAEVGVTLLKSLGSGDAAKLEDGVKALDSQHAKYVSDAAEIRTLAQEKDGETQRAEIRALRFDLGEGFLELGLVLTSLYFLSKAKLFPTLGALSSALGLILAASALVV